MSADPADATYLQSSSPQSLPTISTGTAVTPLQVTQSTQVGAPRRIRPNHPPPLRHHASELLLSPRQRPFYTAPPRTVPLPFDPGFTKYAGFSGYNAITRARRRAYQTQSVDSPTSSLDCLASLKTDGWSMEAMAYQGKINGVLPTAGIPNLMNGLNLTGISVEDRRLGTSASAASSRSCRCSCRCGDNAGEGGGGGRRSEGGNGMPAPDSPEGLSWRRLHMSRAKLKATATTSELLSGFAMIAMVELQINEPTNVPEWLFVMFAVCTTVLVAVHIFALMISTYLLPNIDAVSKMSTGDVLRESPHERMRGFIELAWAFSTVLGLFLFLVEIAILCWVKFWDYSFAAATAATVIVIPVLIVFVAFAVHFYHSLVVTKCEASTEDMKKLESMKRNLDTATIIGNSPV